MQLLRKKRIFLLPSFLTLSFLTLIFLFPTIFTAPVIAMMYWVFGSTIVFLMTRILRLELKHKSQLADELTKQKRFLENVIESAPEGIVWADKKNDIKYVNKKFTELFGYELDEARGHNIDKLLNSKSQLSEAQKITDAVSRGVSEEFEAIRYKKDGSSMHVSIVGAPITSIKGELEIFGIYRDITHEKLAQKKLIDSEKSFRKLSDQLIDANNFKELLLDIITHDLRNPAGVIYGSLELMEDEFPNHEVVEVVRKSSINLFEVIDSASTLSKLSMGESIVLEDIDLVPILKDVAGTFESQLISAGMTLSLDLPPTLNLRANRIIGEVFSNYISNGIKYAAEGGELQLVVVETPALIRIELRDKGETIPEDMRKTIFERKVQLLNGPRQGSGLGLAIVSRIAEAHGANAGLKPNDPTGNTFYFQFPKINE